jgi:hypothetical protein
MVLSESQYSDMGRSEFEMTPRMYEMLRDAHQQIGNYVLLKSDRTGQFRVDSVTKVAATIKPQEIVIDLVTMNGFIRQFNAYTIIFTSRKEAEEAATNLNTKGIE